MERRGGKPIRAMGISQDITERKMAEQALEQGNSNLRRLGHRLTQVFARAVDTSRGICLGLAESGLLEATPAEIEALARNVTVVTLYWLSFDTVRHPRRDHASEAIANCVYQVLMLVAPLCA